MNEHLAQVRYGFRRCRVVLLDRSHDGNNDLAAYVPLLRQRTQSLSQALGHRSGLRCKMARERCITG
jgi:hypothetical protein